MLRKKMLLVCLSLWHFFLLGICSLSYADNAEVLPKGVFRAELETRFYLPVTKRFNPNGDVEDIAVDYNASLNSNVFSGLKQVESIFKLPSGSATIGNSVVSFEYDVTILYFVLQYGI